MELDISPDTEALIQKQIDSGRYQDADEVLVEAIRLLVEHDREVDGLRRSKMELGENPNPDEMSR